MVLVEYMCGYQVVPRICRNLTQVNNQKIPYKEEDEMQQIQCSCAFNPFSCLVV